MKYLLVGLVMLAMVMVLTEAQNFGKSFILQIKNIYIYICNICIDTFELYHWSKLKVETDTSHMTFKEYLIKCGNNY